MHLTWDVLGACTHVLIFCIRARGDQCKGHPESAAGTLSLT